MQYRHRAEASTIGITKRSTNLLTGLASAAVVMATVVSVPAVAGASSVHGTTASSVPSHHTAPVAHRTTAPTTSIIAGPITRHLRSNTATVGTCTIYFTGAADISWENPANWTLDAAGTNAAGRVPSTTDVVCLATNPVRTEVNIESSNPKVAGFNFTNAAGTASVNAWFGHTITVIGSALSVISNLTLNAGTLNLANSGGLTVTNLTDEAAQIDGPATLTMTGTSTFSGLYPDLHTSLTLINDGTATLEAGEELYFFTGSTLENFGTWNMDVNADLCAADSTGDAVLNEAGGQMLGLAGPGGTTTIHIAYQNLGTTESVTGTLAVLNSDPSGLNDAGSWIASAGSVIESGPTAVRTFSASNTVTGAGTLDIEGTANLTSAHGIAVTTTEVGGRLALSAGLTASLNQLLLTSGTVASSGSSSTINLAAAGGLTVDNANGPAGISGIVLNDAGTSEIDASSILDLSAAAQLSNTGTFTMDAGSSILGADATTQTIVNHAGATFNTNAQAPAGQAGSTATINVWFSNAGTLSSLQGTLSMDRSFTQTSTGTFDTELSTSNGVTEFGSLLDTSNVVLAGTLHVATVAGTLPTPGTTYAAITGSAISGSVTTVAPSPANGYAYSPVATSTSVGVLADQPIAITSASSTTFTISTRGSFTVTTSGTPTPTVAESGTLPAGVTFNSATDVLSGTPTVGGVFPITFTATNGTSTYTQSFTLNVACAPLFTSPTYAIMAEGLSSSFTATVVAYPAATFAESGTLPAGVTFDPSTGTLSGTPGANTLGSYPITFTATNSQGTTTQHFVLTIELAPTITSPASATFTVGASSTFHVTASSSPPATYAESGTLPAGVTFNQSTGVFSGTPAAGTGGSYPITLTAINTAGSGTQAFTLYVNQPVAITSAATTTFTTGAAGTFSVTTTGYPAATITESGTLPAGVSFSNGVFSGTPAAGTGGSYPVTITASNVVNTVTQSFTLVVNQAPSITSTNATIFTVGQAGSFTVTASGFPNPTFTESGTLPTGVSFNSTTGVLSGTPAAGTAKIYTLTITATNAAGSNAQTFTLSVAPYITSANSTVFVVGVANSFSFTNIGIPGATYTTPTRLPSGVTLGADGTLSGIPATGTQGSTVFVVTATNGTSTATQTFTLTIDVLPQITSATTTTTFTVGQAGTFTVTDSGVATPTLARSGNLPTGLSFNTSTGVLSGTPAAGTGGSYTLTFTATNSVGVATQTFTLVVDQLPAITSAAATTFTTGTAASFTVTTTGYVAPALTESGSLPTGITFVDNGNGTAALAGTAASGQGGIYHFTITATNQSGSVTQNFTLTVNQVPVFTNAATTTFTTSTFGTFAFGTLAYPVASFSATGSLPNGVIFVDNGNGTATLSGTPGAAQGGSYTLTVKATNSVGSATQTFTLVVNQAPVITSAATTTFTVGSKGTFTAAATGYPTPTYTETGTLPSGVTLTAAGVLSGTPAAGTGGSYPITLTATNAAGSSSQSFTLVVNHAPGFTSSTSATFSALSASSFTVTTSGFPGAVLSQTGALPSGVVFTDLGNGTASIAGTPASGAGGVYTITLTATNAAGSATQTFTLTVNQLPVFTSATSTTFTAGTVSSFTPTVAAYPAVTWSKTGTLPSGISFSTTTGALTGTPSATSGGVYTLTLTATNSQGSTSQTFTLTVVQGPIFTSAATTTFTTGTAGSFTVTTSGLPGAIYTESGALPSGVTFFDNSNGTATLSGTPSKATGGTYTLTLTAQNELATVTQTFTLTVNQAAAFTSVPGATFTVGTSSTFTVTSTGFPAPTYTETGTLPSGVTFTASTGKFSGTPAAGTGGTYPVTVTATNSTNTATQSFTLVVDQGPAFTSTGSSTFTVGTAGSFTVTASGMAAPSYTETGQLPSGIIFVDNGNGSATLSGTPAAGTGGTYAFTITATNELGSVSQTFTLTINQKASFTSVASANFVVGTSASVTVSATGFPVPSFTETGTLPTGLTFNTTTGVLSGTATAAGTWTITLTAGSGLLSTSETFTITVTTTVVVTTVTTTTFTVGTHGSYTFTPTTGTGTPSYSVSGNLPTGVSLNGTTGVLSGTPAVGTGGVYAVTITITNSVVTTFTFTIVVHEAASFTSSTSTTFTVGTAGSYTFTSSGYPYAKFTWTGQLPSGITLVDQGNGTASLFGTPAAGTGGSYSFTVTLTGLTTVTETFTLVINQAPVFTSVAGATFTAGTLGSVTLTTSGYPKATFTESGALPSGLTFVDNGNGTATLSGTPAAGSGGSWSITVTITNAVTTLTETFTITVLQATAFTSSSTVTFTSGVSASFTITASGTPGASYSWSGTLPQGMTVVDQGNGTAKLFGTPGPNAGGTYTLTLTATGLTTVTQTLTIVVNQTPHFTVVPLVAPTFTVGTASSFTYTATGYPAPSYTESGALPVGVTFNATTGVLSGTPASSSGGSYTITITATDTGGSSVQNVTLLVNQAPVFGSSSSATFAVGTSSSVTLWASGYPNAKFTESGALPSGVTVVDNANGTATLSGTPGHGTGGSYTLTLTATSAAGTAVQSFTLTVNQAPVITSSAAATFAAGSASSVTLTSTGFPTSTMSLAGTLPSGVTFTANGAGGGTLSGTPGLTTGGTYPLTLTATNTNGTTTQSFTLTVTQAPTITSAASTAFTVGSAGTLTVTTAGFPTAALSSVGALPTGVTLVDNGNGTASLYGTPAAGTGGLYTITITAKSSVGSVSQTFTLTVDQALVNTSATSTTFTVGSSGKDTLSSTGYPAPTYTETGTLPTGVTLTSAGVLSGTPAAGTGGLYPISITITNVLGSVTYTLNLTVNQPAVVTSANTVTFAVGTAGSFTATATGYSVPTLSESGTLPSGVTFNGTTGVLGGTPAAGTGGRYLISIRATNTSGTTTQSFTLIVTQPPAITSAATTTFTTGTAGTFTVTTTGYPTSSITESGALPAGITFTDNGTGTATLAGTATPGAGGSYPITITSTSTSGTTTQSFVLKVNDAPVFTSAGSATMTVGTGSTVTPTLTGYPAATFTESGTLPAGLSFSAATGAISGIPAAGTAGVYTATITATNVAGSAVETLTLTIDDVPHITSAAAVTFTVGQPLVFQLTATGYPATTWSESGALPLGLMFNAATGQVFGSPIGGLDGTTTVTITATNALGSTTQTLAITVAG